MPIANSDFKDVCNFVTRCRDFCDAMEMEIENPLFFKDIDDRYVRYISETMLIVSNLRFFFERNHWLLDDVDEAFYARHKRFRPAHFHKKRKSYSKLRYYYGQQLEGLYITKLSCKEK